MTNTHPKVKLVISVPRGKEERSQLVKMQIGWILVWSLRQIHRASSQHEIVLWKLNSNTFSLQYFVLSHQEQSATYFLPTATSKGILKGEPVSIPYPFEKELLVIWVWYFIFIDNDSTN